MLEYHVNTGDVSPFTEQLKTTLLDSTTDCTAGVMTRSPSPNERVNHTNNCSGFIVTSVTLT